MYRCAKSCVNKNQHNLDRIVITCIKNKNTLKIILVSRKKAEIIEIIHKLLRIVAI